MFDAARKVQQSFSRIAIFLTMVLVFGAAKTASAQEPGGCLNGLERLMREFQARYYEIAKTNPTLEKNVVDWPPCCPSEKAPAFPPDGYYDSALKGDPALAVELVKALQNLLCEFESQGSGASPMPITGWFNRTIQPNDSHGPVPSYNPEHPLEERWHPASAYGTGCVDQYGTPVAVTAANYCEKFQQLEEGLQKLRTIRLPDDRTVLGSQGCSRIVAGQCGGSAYWDRLCSSQYWQISSANNTVVDCWRDSPDLKCNYSDTDHGAIANALGAIGCVWGALAQIPCSSGGGVPEFREEVEAGMDPQQLGGGDTCFGYPAEPADENGNGAHPARYWGTAVRFSVTGTYRVNFGDIDGKRNVFFRPEYPYGRGNTDSPYRRGNILGLPVDWCTVIPPGIGGSPPPPPPPQPDWIRNPSESANLSYLRYATDATFGGQTDAPTGTATGGMMFLGDSLDGFPADDCKPATGAFSDWGPGKRGWSFPSNGVSGLVDKDFDSDAERGRDCGSTCSSCSQVGNPRAVLGSVDYSWPLGRNPSNDRSTGYLLLRVKSISDRSDAGPGGVHYPDNVISPNRLIRNFQDGSIFSDLAPQPTKDLDLDAQNIPIDNHGVLTSYTISSPISINANSPAYAQLLVQTGAPPVNSSILYRTIVTSRGTTTEPASGAMGVLVDTAVTTLDQSFEWRAVGGEYRKDHIIRIHHVPDAVNGSGSERFWEYKLVDSTWTMKEQMNSGYSTSLRTQEESVGPESNGSRTVVRTVRDSAGVAIDQETTIESRSPKGGWLVSEQWRGTDPHLVRTYNADGNLVREVTPSGHWTDYVYDSALKNLVLKTVSQFKDTLPGSSESQNVVVEGLEIPISDSPAVVIKTQATKVLGVSVSRTIDAWVTFQHYRIGCARPEYTSLQQAALDDVARLTASGDPWRTATDRTTVTWFDNHPIPSLLWKTHTQKIQGSDGSARAFDPPSLNTNTFAETTVSLSGRYAENALLGVASDGLVLTSTVRRTDIGIVTRRDTFEKAPAPDNELVHVSGMMVPEDAIDLRGRATRTLYWTDGDEPTSAADVESRVYDCCHLLQETDRSGVTTKYTYDKFDRIETVSRQVGPGATDFLKTESVYDAMGRVIEEWRYPTGTSPAAQLVRKNHYDANGRMDWSEDAAGEDHRTSYAVTYLTDSGNHPAGMLSRTTMPKPTATQAAPYVDQIVYPDGQLKSVGGTGTVEKSYGYGVIAGTSTQPPLRYTTEYLGSTSPASCTQWTRSWSDPFGRGVMMQFPLTATPTTTYSSTLYNSFGDAYAQIDPDQIYSLSMSGIGWADAQAKLTPISTSLPSGLEDQFKGQWSLSVQDVNANGLIDWSIDRISMSRQYLVCIDTPCHWRRRSESLVWKTGDGTGSTDVLTTSQSESTLDGIESWSTSFDWSTHTLTTVERAVGTGGHLEPTGIVTTVSTDPTGGVTESVQSFGREVSSIHRHPPIAPSTVGEFAGKTVQEYDSLGRLWRSHFLRTESATLNGTSDDVTENSYDALDRAWQQTGPSPYGNGTARHQTAYLFDNLNRPLTVFYPESKQTTYTYNARGQTLTVRGFDVNPVDYGYDALGRMITMSTYGDLAGAPTTTKATTTWNFHPYSGRLENKKYHGNTGTPDLAYTYKPSGRMLTRTTKRGIITSYTYNALGEPEKTSYSDATPSVIITARDRFGRVKEMADAAGRRSTDFLDDGRVLTETIDSDSSITGAPHSNYLAGITLTNGYTLVGGNPDKYPRVSTQVSAGSSNYNHVDFGYDAELRMRSVTKSDGRVEYDYHPITGQMITSTNSVKTAPNTYTGRFRGGRGFDRLGRQTTADWDTVPVGFITAQMVSRSYTTDIHGRRTAMFAGIDENAESWTYGYDDKNQLTSALASFSYTSPAVPVPGLQFGFSYDDIGNRTQVVQGDALTGSTSYAATYTPSTNLLNQYSSRTVPGKIEVSGHSEAPDVYVNGSTTPAYRYMSDDGFFHDRITADNSAGPLRTTISIQDIPPMGAAASYDVYVPGATEAFTYDADGNLSSDGVWNYTWDGENRLTHMEMNLTIATRLVGQSNAALAMNFAYDGMGRRIIKQLDNATPYVVATRQGDVTMYEFAPAYKKKYVYDIGSWNLSTILRCNISSGATIGPDQTFAWGPDLSGSEQGAGGIGGLAIYVDDYNDGGVGTLIGPMFPMYDGNGNILRLYDGSVNSSGLPNHKLAEYRYGPFGEQRGQTGSQASRFPFRWSTKFTDNESGLVYYGYRYYSPSMGRWVSEDPIGHHGGINISAFAENDPVDKVDATGLQPDLYTFSGINNFRNGVGHDYVGDKLILAGLNPHRRWHSKAGFNSQATPNYFSPDRMTANPTESGFWGTATAAILDGEADAESKNLFDLGGGCVGCWDLDRIVNGNIDKNNQPRKTKIHVFLLAPKTTKRPIDYTCCQTNIDVVWSPFDLVPANRPGAPNNESTWAQYGQLHIIDTRFQAGGLDSALGPNPNHAIDAFLTSGPETLRSIALTPRFRTYTLVPEGPAPGWMHTGRTINTMAMIRRAMADESLDQVWVAHSQGTNMAMYSLNRFCASKPRVDLPRWESRP